MATKCYLALAILAREFLLFCLISTPFSAISSRVRGLYAGSRTGAIIQRIRASSRLELFAIVFSALTILVLLGSSGEGQASFLHGWIVGTIEETATAFDTSIRASSMELADLNSVFSGTGGDMSPAPSLEASTVQESAFIAITAPDSSYLAQLDSQRNQIAEYTVQEGDALSFIASDFGVSVSSVLWANNLKDADSISPGQVLRIPPISGVIHRVKQGDTAASVAKKYNADENKLIAYNHLPKDGSIQSGTDIIVPDGYITVSRPSSSVAGGTPVAPLYGTASLAQMVKAAKLFSYLPDLGSFFSAPAMGYNWGLIHGRNGVDVANSCGTVIDSAAGGTVTVADAVGWNGGFGKYVKISHTNGTETLYAHLSKILVATGQEVVKAQKIGLMGTTGRSTGCHLHFEVHGARNLLAKGQ